MAISVRGEQKRGKRKSSQVTKVVFKETSFVLNSTPSLSEFLQKSSADSILEFQVDEVLLILKTYHSEDFILTCFIAFQPYLYLVMFSHFLWLIND